MENKCIKKSTIQQLRVLVEYMEENPEFARGCVIFGSSKMSIEDQWKTIVKKLNSLGPPVRSIAEWKKSWADLKSRTKKKIAENKRSLSETGGGFYKVNPLTELEEIVDRTVHLSKAAAPSGKVFGYSKVKDISTEYSVESCFTALTSTPSRSSKVVAVITPTRQPEISQQHIQEPQAVQQQTQHQQHTVEPPQLHPQQQISERPQLHPQQPILQPPQQTQPQKQQLDDIFDEQPCCSSAKKRKTSEDQLSLIRRQIRVAEQSLDIAKEQVKSTKNLVVAIDRMANAAEAQAEAAKKTAETQEKILFAFESFFNQYAKNNN